MNSAPLNRRLEQHGRGLKAVRLAGLNRRFAYRVAGGTTSSQERLTQAKELQAAAGVGRE